MRRHTASCCAAICRDFATGSAGSYRPAPSKTRGARCPHAADQTDDRRHLAGLTVKAVRLGAVAVTIENIKLVLAETRDAAGSTSVVTAIPPSWPSRRGGGE